MILHGSLTLDDYVPGRSDVDLLAVVGDRPSDHQLASLQEATTDEARRAPRRLDLRVVTRRAASVPTPAPPMELYIGLRPDADPEIETRHEGERDLVVEFSMGRAHGRSLAGSEPSELIAVVPDEWVLDVGAGQLADWQALEYSPRHAELIVLTTCRVWRFAEERRHCSKTAAGEWALRREPTLRAVRDALHQRLVDPMFSITEGPVRELLAVARAHIARARP